MLRKLKAKPDHLQKTLTALDGGAVLSPLQISKVSGLSLTAVNGAIEELASEGKVELFRQNSTPKLTVKLSQSGSPES